MWRLTIGGGGFEAEVTYVDEFENWLQPRSPAGLRCLFSGA